MTVISRFAPSPTGYLHIGNARMALINYLFSKKHGGNFILRIDDTDLERSKEEYTTGIKEDLNWLGITWDSTFKQSEKIEVYNKHVQTLIAEEKLYPCYETKDELEYKKKLRLAKGEPPIYDRAMLKLTNEQKIKYEQEGRRPHYRFKMDHSDIEWVDLVKGSIKFHGSNISDPVLIKDNGVFLYSLCSVIDDIESNISHIIRGEDHLSNTAMHIQLFQCLGGVTPHFGHLPLISMLHGEELSKRSGSMSLRGLRNKGILAEAILNYLFLLGQAENSKLDYSLTEMVVAFNLGDYGKSLVKFDLAKLDQINALILQQLSFNEVKDELIRLGLSRVDQKLWDLYKNNIVNLVEINKYYDVLYGEIKVNSVVNKALIKAAINNLPSSFNEEQAVELWLKAITAEAGLKGKDLFISLRVALTGEEHGVPFKDLIIALGAEKIQQRLNNLI